MRALRRCSVGEHLAGAQLISRSSRRAALERKPSQRYAPAPLAAERQIVSRTTELLPNLALFGLAIVPFAATLLIQELLLRPMVQANPSDQVPDLSLFSRTLILFANTHMRFMGWIFLIGPVFLALIAILNTRARHDSERGSDRWRWSALCAVLFVSSAAVALLVFRRAGDFALLLYWMSLVAGAIALGEAFVTQKTRRDAGRSRWSPSFVVASGTLLSLIHPILLALVSIAPQLLSWREGRP